MTHRPTESEPVAVALFDKGGGLTASMPQLRQVQLPAGRPARPLPSVPPPPPPSNASSIVNNSPTAASPPPSLSPPRSRTPSPRPVASLLLQQRPTNSSPARTPPGANTSPRGVPSEQQPRPPRPVSPLIVGRPHSSAAGLLPQPGPPPNKVLPMEFRAISPSRWQGGSRGGEDSPRRSQMLGVRAAMEAKGLNTSSPAILTTSPRSISPSPLSRSDADGESRRTKVAREMLSSERVYLNNLRLIVNTLLQPVKTGAKGAAPVDAKVLGSIFLNVEGILAVNSELERNLAERISTWNDDTSCVGDVFLRLGPFLRMYTQYASRYDAAIAELCELQKENSAFNAWLSKWRDENASGHTLADFLIQPVQRIPRYNLLLSDLIRRTDPSHPDYSNLQQALAAMQNVAAYVNDSIRESENKARLLEIHKSFHRLGDHISLIEPHRSFIKEGTLTKVCRSSRKSRRFWLFTDILLYGSVAAIGSKHVFHGVLELYALKVEDVTDSEAKKLTNAFLISAAKKSFVVYADSPAEKAEWLACIGQTCAAWKEKRATFKGSMGALDQPAEAAAPVWTPDGDASSCVLCSAEFTIIRRRHHCRSCGKLVCGDCSSFKLVLPHLAKEPVRVCRTCHSAHLPQPVQSDPNSNDPTQQQQQPQQQQQQTPPMLDKRTPKSLSLLGFS